MIERGMTASDVQPRFQALAIGTPLTWKYRGQVLPHNRTVVVEVELTAVAQETGGSQTATAKASLWVDGTRIYEARNLTMRVMEG
jgi:hypothetical protein